MKYRSVNSTWKSQPTMEGAGVRLDRAFSRDGVRDLDPFLLLDSFHSADKRDYEKGFPWHPHRGMETITYIIEGEVEHGDSMGNRGVIRAGDVQWMTAGSGIIHQEMPRGNAQGRMGGFQLWSNLPARQKMMDPRYQEIKAEQIPQVTLPDGATVRVICGKVGDVEGPVRDIVTNPEYLDVQIAPHGRFEHAVPEGHTLFAYVYDGETNVGKTGTVVLFSKDGDGVRITTGDHPARFLLVSGQPLGEPVAWAGPIVMNTREELTQAFAELDRGTFVKHKVSSRQTG